MLDGKDSETLAKYTCLSVGWPKPGLSWPGYYRVWAKSYAAGKADA